MTAQPTHTEQSLATVAHPTAMVAFDAVRMRISPAEAERRHKQLEAFVQAVMVAGIDYGTMPGTDKKTLFKPGAEKLAQLYGLTWRWVWKEAVKDWERGFFYFESECTLIDRETSTPICNCIASCNSREDKYGYRWEWEDAARANGIDTRGLKVKLVGKNNGKKVRIPNDDPYSLVNTLQKMSNKRSLVGAVIAATASSGIFTQDVEDFSDETLTQLLGDVDNVQAWKKGNAQDKRADLLDGLLQRLGEAKTDQECRAVGVTMSELVNLKQITEADAQGLRAKIAEKRERPEIKATVGKKPEPKADPKPAEATKDATKDGGKGEAPKAETSQSAPEAAKSEPKPKEQAAETTAAENPTKPQKRVWAACGKQNDGCTCSRPEGHDGLHFDEQLQSEW